MNRRVELARGSGFTLIEVVVSLAILMSVIGLTATIFGTSTRSSATSESHLLLTASLPSIIHENRFGIREAAEQGLRSYEVEASAGRVKYTVLASVIQEGKTGGIAANQFQQADTQREIQLWQVDLSVSYNSTSERYQYKELAWQTGDAP